MTIRQDAFTRDLGDDFVALDSRGHGVARASSLDALKAAAPGATSYLDQKGLDKALNDEKSARRNRDKPDERDYAQDAIDDRARRGTDPTVAAQRGAGDKNSDQKQAALQQQIADSEALKSEPSGSSVPQETPVNQTKSGQESRQPGSFDHDGDGKDGGSPKGENSTAARGRAARQRKSAR